MLDPYITPCCDQKQLRYFFEKVDRVGHGTFFCETDYSMTAFLYWLVYKNPMSEITVVTQVLSPDSISRLEAMLSAYYYDYLIKKNVPLITSLNLMVSPEFCVPDSILNDKRVVVAKDVFTHNFILVHRTSHSVLDNRTLEADTSNMKAYISALKNSVTNLETLVNDENTERAKKQMAIEQVESDYIDYMLTTNLGTSSKDQYYSMHGAMPLGGGKPNTHAVTVIKGKAAYDDIMASISSKLRRKKITPPSVSTTVI